MNELDIQALPLLPLTTGVVLPGMVVTLTIESDEARAAVGATSEGDDALLLTVPRVEGRYARVGVVAKIEDVGRMRNGVEAVVIRGLRRATVGLGRARDRRGDLGPDRAGGGAGDRASQRARQGVPRGGRGHHGCSRGSRPSPSSCAA